MTSMQRLPFLWILEVGSTFLLNLFSVYQNVKEKHSKPKDAAALLCNCITLLLFGILWNLAVQSATRIFNRNPGQSI